MGDMDYDVWNHRSSYCWAKRLSLSNEFKYLSIFFNWKLLRKENCGKLDKVQRAVGFV